MIIGETYNDGWSETPDFTAWKTIAEERRFDWSLSLTEIEKKFKKAPKETVAILDDSYIEKRIERQQRQNKEVPEYTGERFWVKFDKPAPKPIIDDGAVNFHIEE